MSRQCNNLICYDIANRSRLQRVHRRVRCQARRLQQLVYFFRGNQTELKALIKDLTQIIKKSEDDIRIYPLAASQPILWFGQQPYPEDIMDFGMPQLTPMGAD